MSHWLNIAHNRNLNEKKKQKLAQEHHYRPRHEGPCWTRCGRQFLDPSSSSASSPPRLPLPDGTDPEGRGEEEKTVIKFFFFFFNDLIKTDSVKWLGLMGLVMTRCKDGNHSAPCQKHLTVINNITCILHTSHTVYHMHRDLVTWSRLKCELLNVLRNLWCSFQCVQCWGLDTPVSHSCTCVKG